nr:hypothetical protein [Hassallia sp. WJT32-NPBG1]
IVIKLFSSATKTSGCSCVYRVVAWRAARLHRAIACDSCVSPASIELCWSKLKQFLRSCEARTLESLDQAMALAVNYITEDDAYEKVQSLWSIYLKIAVID